MILKPAADCRWEGQGEGGARRTLGRDGAHAAPSPLVAARLRRRRDGWRQLAAHEPRGTNPSRWRVSRGTTAPLDRPTRSPRSSSTPPRWGSASARRSSQVFLRLGGRAWSLRRWAIVLGFVTVVAAFLVFVLRPQLFPAGRPPGRRRGAAGAAALPPRGPVGGPGRRLQRRPHAAAVLANERRLALRDRSRHVTPTGSAAETRRTTPSAEAIARRLADGLGVHGTTTPRPTRRRGLRGRIFDALVVQPDDR